jgi:hypothetical protein
MKAIRHGDLCLVRITEMPDNIKPVKTKTIMQGSHGNNHDVKRKRRIIYLEDDVIACASSTKTWYWERCYF